MKSSVEFSLFAPWFSPAEVEKISGVSLANQRDWRRRGFLPSYKSGKEWARFDSWLVLMMWLVKLLGDRGITPKEGMQFAAHAATDAWWHSLMRRQAYAGGHELTFLLWESDEALEKIKGGLRNPADWPRYAKMYGLDEKAPIDWLWQRQAEFLGRELFKARGLAEILPKTREVYQPARFMVWRADGTHDESISLDETFEGFYADGIAGAVIVFDLAALATEFLARAARPLVEVHYHVWLDAPAEREPRERAPSFIPDAELVAHLALDNTTGRWT